MFYYYHYYFPNLICLAVNGPGDTKSTTSANDVSRSAEERSMSQTGEQSYYVGSFIVYMYTQEKKKRFIFSVENTCDIVLSIR